MTDERQIAELPENQVSTKRGFPVYRTNPSVPSANGMPTRNKRFQVPGGKGAMIVDNSTGELKGIGGMGFWWEEEVDPDSIRQVVPRWDQAGRRTVEDWHAGV